MSEALRQDIHPDEDSLAAFAEGVLPEGHDQEFLSHVAFCPRCREIIYLTRQALADLAEDASPVVASRSANPESSRKWFMPMAGLALAASLVWVILLVQRHSPAPHQAANPIKPSGEASNSSALSHPKGASAPPGRAETNASAKAGPPLDKPGSSHDVSSANPPGSAASHHTIPALTPTKAVDSQEDSAEKGKGEPATANQQPQQALEKAAEGSGGAANDRTKGNEIAGNSDVVAGAKRKVAVLDFSYAKVQTESEAMLGTKVDIGKFIADMLMKQLGKENAYQIVGRSELEKILKEQNLSDNDRTDPATAAKIGRILGVDAVIVGDIFQFGRDDAGKSRAFGSRGIWHGAGFGRTENSRAVVSITARIVDSKTDEILGSVTGKGVSTRAGSLLGRTDAGSGADDTSEANMGIPNISGTFMGDAVNQAVSNLASGLESRAGSLPPIQPRR